MYEVGVEVEPSRTRSTVESIMERAVVALRPDQPLEEAVRQLEVAGVSGAPVVEGGRVVGVVELRALFEAAEVPFRLAATSGPWHRDEHRLAGAERRVSDAMNTDVVFLAPDSPIAVAAVLMRDHGINRISVIDHAGALRGIVARDDIVRFVAETVRALHAVGAPGGRQRMTPD
jgi:CBS domain-containing protein